MPEDNYLQCMNAIAETMKGTNWKGEWYGKRGFFHVFYLWKKIMCLFQNLFVRYYFVLKGIFSNY